MHLANDTSLNVSFRQSTNDLKSDPKYKIAVVIPSYKVKKHIMKVLDQIPQEIWRIYVVDDCCPDETGNFVLTNSKDPRVYVLFHKKNLGVGGAVLTGYSASITNGADVIVKIDGDGQMDPALIPFFVNPIFSGEADYTKGNRFFNLEKISSMPKMRLFGNSVLSFITKISSGYWQLFDPTNGYTAIHAEVAQQLCFAKIDPRYFFESDMLFRLNILRAVVLDVPIDAKYAEEVSQLKIISVIIPFLIKHSRNFLKRIFYNYYLRDLSLASLELPMGLILFFFGMIFGGYHWFESAYQGVPATSGTVMVASLPIVMGINFMMAFLNYDMTTIPKHVFHKTAHVKIF